MMLPASGYKARLAKTGSYQLVDINLPNVLTVAIISLGAIALVKFGLNAAGVSIPSWL